MQMIADEKTRGEWVRAAPWDAEVPVSALEENACFVGPETECADIQHRRER